MIDKLKIRNVAKEILVINDIENYMIWFDTEKTLFKKESYILFFSTNDIDFALIKTSNGNVIPMIIERIDSLIEMGSMFIDMDSIIEDIVASLKEEK